MSVIPICHEQIELKNSIWHIFWAHLQIRDPKYGIGNEISYGKEKFEKQFFLKNIFFAIR
jgi:hypothetical protein